MQVVLHAGAHLTDDEKLLTCLIKNHDLIAQNGTHIPDPKLYRNLLRDCINQMQKTTLDPAMHGRLIKAVLDEKNPERIILANPSFFGTPKMAVSGERFYGMAVSRMQHLQDLFSQSDVELFLAIRNPATFLPAILDTTQFNTFSDLLRGADPANLRWAELVERLRNNFPNLAITIWCNEDTPMIWSQILREMAGLEETVTIEGEFALLPEIMTEEGTNRLLAYLEAHPNLNELQKRRVIALFLENFAESSAIEEELDYPGWTEEVINQLTEIYDEDLYQLQQIPGVNVIVP